MGMKTLFLKRNIESKGTVTVRSYKAGTVDRVQNIYASIKNRDSRWLERAELKNKRALELTKKIFSENFLGQMVQSNLIMKGANTGKDLLVDWLISGYTGSNVGLGINWGAIGTGSTTPAITDTQLTTETDRVIPAFAQVVGNNEAQIQFFFTDSILANATYREFGTFVGGTATPNSGSIFNHALFGSPYVKVTGVDTTVEVDIELT